MSFGGLFYFVISFGLAAFLAAKDGGGAPRGRLWLRSFLISMVVSIIFALVGFATADAGKFDAELLALSLLLDAGWAAFGAILGVIVGRRTALRK